MTVKLSNNATSRLATSISSSDTTIVVQAGEGAKFPTLSGDDTFPITMVKADGSYEIGRCTARSSDTLTITRGQEGVSAKSFSAGDRIELRLTEGAFEERLGEKFDKAGGDISGPITLKGSGGMKRWEIVLPDSASDDLAIKRYDNDGLDVGDALTIDRATGAVQVRGSDDVRPLYIVTPNSYKGEIDVVGVGPMKWNGSKYVACSTARISSLAAGTIDARTAVLDPAITAYVDQELYLIRIPAANATATPTLNLGGGAKTVVKGSGFALKAGDMLGDCVFQWNATLDEFVLINPATSAALNTLDGQLGFTIIYPNGGSEASPANVVNNTTYILANPFPGCHVYCKAEILVAGQWGTTGYWSSNTASHGLNADQRLPEDNIVVVAGVNSLLMNTSGGNWALGSLRNAGTSVTSAPCRVLVWKLKGATA